MRHPVEKYNQIQAERLAELPEAQRDYMARMFRIGNTAYRYHNRVNDLPVFDTGQPDSPADLLEWLEQMLEPATENRSAHELLQVYFEEYLAGLPHEGVRRSEQEKGLDEARRSWPFRRYVLERHDIGMEEFMRLNLSEEDYAFHVETSKPIDSGHMETT